MKIVTICLDFLCGCLIAIWVAGEIFGLHPFTKPPLLLMGLMASRYAFWCVACEIDKCLTKP
jgi:hypothetical protein